VAVVNVHVLTRLELMPQVEVGDFMGDGKALSIGGIGCLNGDDAGGSLADEQTGNILAEFGVGNLQTQVPCHPLNIDRRLRKATRFSKGFPVMPG